MNSMSFRFTAGPVDGLTDLIRATDIVSFSPYLSGKRINEFALSIERELSSFIQESGLEVEQKENKNSPEGSRFSPSGLSV